MTESEEIRAAYTSVFQGAAGQQVLADIERQGMADRTTFHPEALRMAFNEGRRSLALSIARLARGAAADVVEGGGSRN